MSTRLFITSLFCLLLQADASEPPSKAPAGTKEKSVPLPVMTWFHPVLPAGRGDVMLLCTVTSAKQERMIYERPYWDVHLRIDERIYVGRSYIKDLEGVKFLEAGDFRERKSGDRVVVFCGGEPYQGVHFLSPCWSGTNSDLGIPLHPASEERDDENNELLKQLRKAAKGSLPDSEFHAAFANFCPAGVADVFIRQLRHEELKKELEPAGAPTK